MPRSSTLTPTPTPTDAAAVVKAQTELQATRLSVAAVIHPVDGWICVGTQRQALRTNTSTGDDYRDTEWCVWAVRCLL